MVRSEKRPEAIRLDLNNPVFQRQLFALEKAQQLNVLATLRKLSNRSWQQLYLDRGLKWELIYSRTGLHGGRLHSLRISKGFRAVAYRDEGWMRILSLHGDHDSAYG
ncbi:hypothetical protein [Nitrosococcus wardiae]|uniref:Type II toxin-antitoxin system RelE/ParE family toxin n=1 Tax=Nitrosococcus wardiae TaxID=1814290 RepID=A0A4P7BY97_9GAMM|nr:hypothetical protein [Nitrosococcus wardiae]QBQ55143.1 hypothetical protein E3U44_11970 [Nitrosococcus wardiae]